MKLAGRFSKHANSLRSVKQHFCSSPNLPSQNKFLEFFSVARPSNYTSEHPNKTMEPRHPSRPGAASIFKRFTSLENRYSCCSAIIRRNETTARLKGKKARTELVLKSSLDVRCSPSIKVISVTTRTPSRFDMRTIFHDSEDERAGTTQRPSPKVGEAGW